jgi:hypothetical protein
MTVTLKLAWISVIVALFLVIFSYQDVSAQTQTLTNLGAGENARCIQVCAQNLEVAKKTGDASFACPPIGKTFVPCGVSPQGGTVSGYCYYGAEFQGCKSISASGVGGGNSIDPSGQVLSGMLSQLMQQLMKGLGGGGGGGSDSGSGGSGGSYSGSGSGCTQYYAVSSPSSDPCAYYVPGYGTVPSSINLNTGTGTGNYIDLSNDIKNSTNNSGSGGLGDIFNGGNSNPISSIIDIFTGGGAVSATPTAAQTIQQIANGGVSPQVIQGATSLGQSGPTGQIRVLPNGVTIVVTNQDIQSNTVTAGFLGNQVSTGRTSTGLAATWCRSRPWATNFLSFIIPATFFDSLCSLSGYQVGESTQSTGTAQVGSQSSIIRTPQTKQNATNTVVNPPVTTSPPMQVDIWAEPPTVPLGGRATIFWNSRNAASCVETSPDGSFSHSTLSGGAATVPVSGPTTFTISCIAPDGTYATDFVTVRLSL